ncbi:hypothetical protein [Saccharibacillus sacchari]|uniref:Uncharacterized protein n=1 Tax=Saccharibacillus sacchari TaxID=456493 RepID=A0ACC6PGR5_9BACL
MKTLHRFSINASWLAALVLAGGLLSGCTVGDGLSQKSTSPLPIPPSSVVYEPAGKEASSLSNKTEVTKPEPSQEIYLDNGLTGWKIEAQVDDAAQVSNTIYRTEDRGAKWTKLDDSQTGSFPTGAVRAVRFVDATRGWVAVDPLGQGDPYLYETKNGGASWSKTALKVPADFREAWFEPKTPILFEGTRLGVFIAQTGYAADGHDVNPLLFYVTADGGATWSDPLQSEQGELNGLIWKTKRLSDGIGRNWSITVEGRTWTFERSVAVEE